MGERGEEQAEVSGFIATSDHGDIWPGLLLGPLSRFMILVQPRSLLVSVAPDTTK